MNSVKTTGAPVEGRRERKRRETRARIADVALSLFQEKGFSAVTIDEIAEASDISKPTFFNYFSAKEDVVLAWQDKFAVLLSEEIASRPEAEPMVKAIEEAMVAAIASSASPKSFAITDLIRATPALAARNQAKYVYLESALVEALLTRDPDADPLEVKLLAMMAVGGLRIGSEEWHISDAPSVEIATFTRQIFSKMWAAIGRISQELEAR